MNNIAWLIVGDFGHINGMVCSVRKIAEKVKIIVAGSGELAKEAAKASADELFWYESGVCAPAESFAEAAAAQIVADDPMVILALEDAISRVIWAKAAVKLDAACVGTAVAVSADGGKITAKRLIADDRSVLTVETEKALAAIFNGEETDPCGAETAIVKMTAEADSSVKLLEGEGAVEESGLKKARKVLGVGYGVANKEMLGQVYTLAEAMEAEVGCSLPIARQLFWMDEHRVVGVTHNTIAPELYIALGVSGQPQHMSGVKDAKIVVGINADPEAPIFQKADYGIVGRLEELLPALLTRLQKSN